jgi:hypothetical protein
MIRMEKVKEEQIEKTKKREEKLEKLLEERRQERTKHYEVDEPKLDEIMAS